MSIKITGLDEMRRKFETIGRNAAALNGKQSVPLKDMLTPSFLGECSTFESFDHMLAKSGFKVESQSDFAAIPDDDWDQFIRSNTTYLSWREMLQAASAKWAVTKLGF